MNVDRESKSCATLREELAEARASYRLANQRIIELLDAKIRLLEQLKLAATELTKLGHPLGKELLAPENERPPAQRLPGEDPLEQCSCDDCENKRVAG